MTISDGLASQYVCVCMFRSAKIAQFSCKKMSLLPDLNANEDETSYYADKTWVQCESPRCLKWRLVPKGDEAVAELDHGKSWHCHMNPDPLFSHCSIPQGPFPKNSQLKEHGLKVVYSLLPVGSLVLVKACNWPWYGMVGSWCLCVGF